MEEDKIIAVVFLMCGEKYQLAINPIVVNPALRNQGYCKRIIKELIEYTADIIGQEKYVFAAGINLGNMASVRSFEKVGFVLTNTHPAGDFGYYHYEKKAPPEMEAQIKEIWENYAQDMANIYKNEAMKQMSEAEQYNDLYLQWIDGVPYKLKEPFDFSFLRKYGKVFKVFDEQWINVCFGIDDGAHRYFVKFAGAKPTNFNSCNGGDTVFAVECLKKTVSVYQDLKHPSLIKFIKAEEIGGGYAAVFEWEDAIGIEPLNSPDYMRFMQMPIEDKIQAFEDIMAFHAYVAEKGYVALDFYDGSILYDYDKRKVIICDIDFYQKSPYIGDIGLMGSTRFVSPEECTSGAVMDEVTNVYTMGATAFSLFAYGDRSPEAWSFNTASYEAVKKAVNDERDKRQQSIRQLIDEWRAAVELNQTQNIYDNPVFFDGYKKLRENPDNANLLEEKPALFSLAPDLIGKTVLDLGCGCGENCMEFKRLGADRVTGIDISEKMLAVAKTETSGIEYIRVDMNDLSNIPNKYDVVFSSLAVHYIGDFARLCNQIAGLLRDGGYFIFSQEHPLTTAPLKGVSWTKDENGQRLYYNLSDYARNGRREMTWFVDGVVKYHRIFSEIINALTANGFVVEKMLEPVPDEKTIERLPRFEDELHKPNFLLIRAKKTK